jgi:hypothetical protein
MGIKEKKNGINSLFLSVLAKPKFAPRYMMETLPFLYSGENFGTEKYFLFLARRRNFQKYFYLGQYLFFYQEKIYRQLEVNIHTLKIKNLAVQIFF